MWVKIDDAAPLHPKLLDAGAEAAWLWVAGLAHANRHTTDGRIEGRHLAALYPPLGSKARRLARKLVEIGLWIECGDGYRIHDYEEYQEQAMSSARDAKRARDAERARRYRERKRAEKAKIPREKPQRHAVTGRDASRVTERDASRDENANASRDVVVDAALIYPGASRCPDPTRPVPSRTLSLTRESEYARDAREGTPQVTHQDPSVIVAESYRTGYRERFGVVAPRLHFSDGRVSELVRLAREQAELEGVDVRTIIDRFFARFWPSESAARLRHQPGSMQALFSELMATKRSPAATRGPAPARDHSEFEETSIQEIEEMFS